MADRSSFVGARLRVTTSEGDYEGTVHSIDTEKRKLTLTKGKQSFPFIGILFLILVVSRITRDEFVNTLLLVVIKSA